MASSEMVVSDLRKTYGYGQKEKIILEDCSFTLRGGEITVLIGPSGSGKSTLVNLLAGYEMPDSGNITLDGVKVKGPGGDRLVVFQETALFPWMSTYSNVAFGPLVQRKIATAQVEARVSALLEKVGLQDFRNKYPSHLSGGMQRRCELARMLANMPKVMMLDEPFRGLDAMTREIMQEYFVRLLEEQKGTVLFITSEIDEAIFMADRLLIMSNAPGRIIKEIKIDLPRPREKEILLSSKVQHYKRDAMDLLHAEALKAFSSGSRAVQDFLEGYERQQELV